jgi:AcrR family transcriptional regulator
MALDSDKQHRILAAATDRFARFGFKKTSIDEIAADAGVGKGTVYLMAESKEDLFYQVVHRELHAWTAQCAPHIDPRVPADELLLRITVAAYAYLEERPLVKDLVLGNHEVMLPLWQTRLADLRAITGQNTEEVLRIGVRQGKFRADLDVPGTARLLQDLLAACLLYAYRTKVPREDQVANTMLFIDLLLRGILPRT